MIKAQFYDMHPIKWILLEVHIRLLCYFFSKSRTSNMHFGVGLYITSSIIKHHDGQLILKTYDKTKRVQVIIKISY